jgi:multicomponent Na+:H+ antiporter subunit G
MIISAGWLLCSVGVAIILVAASGIIRLPDAMSRQHAATKATTMAVVLFVIGTILIVRDTDWTWRLLAILFFLLLTLPLSSHVLCRTAYREANSRNQ